MSLVAKYSDITSKGIITNHHAVEQSLDNILSLSPFDVFFNQVGSGLDSLLFKPMNKATTDSIFYALTSAIEKVDDRILIDKKSSDVIADYDNHHYNIQINYKIKGLDDSIYSYNRIIKVQSGA